MSKGREYLIRWRTEYDFKTVIGAWGSLVATVLFALYNGYLGIRYQSLCFGSIIPAYPAAGPDCRR